MKNLQHNIVLTITGSDSIGESGVQADLRTFYRIGCQSVSAITCVTVQNTLGIQQFYDLPTDIVEAQIDAIMNDVEPAVVKIGMVRSADMVDAIAHSLLQYRPAWVIYHPVLTSSHGERLMSADVLARIRHTLLPLCSLIVVKQSEAQLLFGENSFSLDRVHIIDDRQPLLHGESNYLSAAVAAYLCTGINMHDAITKAGQFVQRLPLKTGRMQGRADELYNAFITQLKANVTGHSDVMFYADVLNVSTRYLAQVTRKVSGKSPKALIDSLLLQRIEQLLTTTTDSIQQVACSTGFNSQAHLARFFKKLTGTTPGKFRKG